MVCVSLAARGAFLITEEQTWFGQAPKIKARGTVGAGDSFVGAFTSRLAQAGIWTPDLLDAPTHTKILPDALAWGLAAGAATAESVGTSLAKASNIRRLRKEARVKSVV